MKILSKKTLAETAMQAIRAEIAAGRWPVGSRLPNETVLSGELGVSRSTLREAVRALVAQGILETRQGAGTFVRALSDDRAQLDRLRHASLRDRFEIRALLEAEAARLAALRAGPDAVMEMRRLLHERGERMGAKDGDFLARDFAFHQCVVAASGNKVLMEIYNFFSTSVREAIEATFDSDLPEPDLAAHTAIVDAIAAHDAEGAARATRQFMLPILERLKDLLDE
ncbi:FadR/GntR family transcriptional regulator [Daeguia caeni]|uniref:FadR/GntR family transcriptional regulator n=1 Tax=Daeguia caeni TaxID=439612 RepID=A0ABV9HA88_9HYPH